MHLKFLSGKGKTGRRAGMLCACVVLLMMALAAAPATWAFFTAEVKNEGNTIAISQPAVTMTDGGGNAVEDDGSHSLPAGSTVIFSFAEGSRRYVILTAGQTDFYFALSEGKGITLTVNRNCTFRTAWAAPGGNATLLSGETLEIPAQNP